MKILYAASEVAPFVKVGGLADVAGALPAALARLGHDVRIVMPLYGVIPIAQYNLKKIIDFVPAPLGIDYTGTAIFEGQIPGYEGGAPVPIYFVQNQHHFERPNIYGYDDDGDRFTVFCQAALQMLSRLNWKPDIIHANDWHTALLPTYLGTSYKWDTFLGGIKSAISIHNLAYQGIFEPTFLRQIGLEGFGIVFGDTNGKVNLLGRGIAYSTGVSTVSPTYATEILTPQYGEGLDWLLNYRWGHLWGITNGIDYSVYNPATDASIAATFDEHSLSARTKNKQALQQEVGLPTQPHVPLFGMVTRLTAQKGLDLLVGVLEDVARRGAQVVILGTGDYYYHELLWNMSQRFPQNIAVRLAFDGGLAQRIYAGTDFFLMPSRFEPCGIGQMIAMRYGSVPVVRHTGGLVDTVEAYDLTTLKGNGFAFGPYTVPEFVSAIDRGLSVYGQSEQWGELVKTNMRRENSWLNSAQQYVEFYHAEVLK